MLTDLCKITDDKLTKKINSGKFTDGGLMKKYNIHRFLPVDFIKVHYLYGTFRLIVWEYVYYIEFLFF